MNYYVEVMAGIHHVVHGLWAIDTGRRFPVFVKARILAVNPDYVPKLDRYFVAFA